MTSRQVAWGSCTAVANASIGVGLGCLGEKVSFIKRLKPNYKNSPKNTKSTCLASEERRALHVLALPRWRCLQPCCPQLSMQLEVNWGWHSECFFKVSKVRPMIQLRTICKRTCYWLLASDIRLV